MINFLFAMILKLYLGLASVSLGEYVKSQMDKLHYKSFLFWRWSIRIFIYNKFPSDKLLLV